MKRNIMMTKYLVLLIGFIAFNSRCVNPRNEAKYFIIKDTAINNLSANPIDNLEVKNGFKNIFLGSNINEYQFNPREWNTIKESKSDIVIYNKDFDGQLVINNVTLDKIKLIFFKETLISINVYSKLSKELQNITGLYSTLTELYGIPNRKTALDFNGRDKYDNELNLIYKVPICTQSIRYNMDKQSGIYFQYTSQIIEDKYWVGSNVYLQYINNCVGKRYDPDMKEGALPKSGGGEIIYESTEFFSISNKNKLEEYYNYVETKRQQKEADIEREKSDQIRSESNKL